MSSVLSVPIVPLPSPLSADWEDVFWQDVPEQRLSHYMGGPPRHFPDTRFRLACNDSHLYVIFRVRDRYVRAVAHRHQDPVYRDSCVELFFTPGTDLSVGYFNLEMNCGGIILFHHQREGGAKHVLPEHLCEQVRVAHSAPRIVDPEITEPTTWCVEAAIPLNLLVDYCEFEMPAEGVVWRGNAYKCADDSSHPHWLTWAPVNHPEPNFHLPAYFGEWLFVR